VRFGPTIQVQCDHCGECTEIDVPWSDKGKLALKRELRTAGWLTQKAEDFCPSCVADDAKLTERLAKARRDNNEEVKP